jgi:peptidyl-prolyl cis-trans isomerase SurA
LEIAMPGMRLKLRPLHQWLAGAIAAAAFTAVVGLPSVATAQVVVIANGSPITELDIQQRMKLIAAAASGKSPARQDVIKELIDDRLKIARAKVYGVEISEAEIDASFENMARRQRLTPPQFAQLLERSGISPGAIKARLRAELTWNNLVRGKFNSALQVGESDITTAMRSRNEADTKAVNYSYTLYPITIITERSQGEGGVDARRREAEALRSRFTTCNEGLPMARALRNVAVREPIRRTSGDLPPEATAQGIQMFALCDKKESSTDSPVKREVREELYNKRFETESKKFLEEIRKQAMIEYK